MNLINNKIREKEKEREKKRKRETEKVQQFLERLCFPLLFFFSPLLNPIKRI